MSYETRRPEVRCKSLRHALLFELIRQRNMAKFISDRIGNQPSTDPTDLDRLARSAGLSLGMPPETRPPVL
jgi:hypothetical protein